MFMIQSDCPLGQRHCLATKTSAHINRAQDQYHASLSSSATPDTIRSEKIALIFLF